MPRNYRHLLSLVPPLLFISFWQLDAQPQELSKSSYPNIIIILADDLGFSDIGYRSSDLKTPHLDKLAADGVKLDTFYSLPFCTQTRAALHSGRYPHRLGLQNRVIRRFSNKALPEDEEILPQTLKKIGYATAIIGKWHLGHSDPAYLPNARGFDYHFGTYHGFIDYYAHHHRGKADLYRNGTPVSDEGYITQLFAKDAIKWLKERDIKKPFLLYLPFTAAHAPLKAPKGLKDRFLSIKNPKRRLFAATVAALDDAIGDIVNTTKKQNTYENTVFFFASDNGASVRAGGSVGSLRGGKGELYEGGIRVPAFITYPNKISKNRSTSELWHVVDIFPSLMGLLGVPLEKEVDGKDRSDSVIKLATLNQKIPNEQPTLLAVLHNAGSIRAGTKKLIYFQEQNSAELYDLADDPSEQKNIVHQNKLLSERLISEIKEHLSLVAPQSNHSR